MHINEGSDAEKLFTVVQVSQRLCNQTDVDSVVRTFIDGAMAISRACRVRLLRREGETFIVEYDAEALEQGVQFFPGGAVSESEVSLKFALRNVLRTTSVVHFDNSPAGYGAAQRKTDSRPLLSPALCIPLTSGNQELEILCLDRMPDGIPFEPATVNLLLLLSTQATVCLENLRYRAHIRTENIQREKVEMTLRASETALAEAQRMSRTGSWRWEVETDTVQASDEFFRIYGLEYTLVSPRSTFTDLVHSDDIQAVHRVVDAATTQRKSFRTEYRIHAANGDLKYLQNEGHPQFATDGALCYVGIVMDTTERRNAEKALQATKAQLASALRLSTMGELAASIIHEINQPLTGIMTNSQVCLRWLLPDPPQIDRAREAAKRLVGDAERAANVFCGLRALASKTGIVQVPVDIDDAIEEVALLLRGELERGNIRLEIRRGTQRAVHGDRFQLQQVIENLMHNAIDAMLCVNNSPRRLTITSEPEREGVAMVTVHDTGCGFGSHSPEELFDTLFTTKPHGMGMGLKVCRSIVEAHGGKLLASSGTDGTKFQFTLPYVRCELHRH
jgi:PAS domain S-box-containing protein